MHFCADELYALLSVFPQLEYIYFWCRAKLVLWRGR